MALCKAGGGVTELRGSISGNTFSRNRGGMIVRARTVPTNTRSNSQSKSRSLFAFLTAAWNKELTPAQRTAWDTYAHTVASNNKLGETIHLTGQLHFIRTNQVRMTAGLSLGTNGPITLSLPAKDPTLYITGVPPSTLAISFDDTAAWCSEDGAAMSVLVSRPQQTTKNYFDGPWRFAGAILGSSGSPPTSPAQIALPFTIAANQKLFAKALILRADGRTTNPFTCSVTNYPPVDFYTEGDDGSAATLVSKWHGESFIASENYQCSMYALKFYREGIPVDATASLRNADVNGIPTGADLCVSTIAGSLITNVSPGEWYYFVPDTRPSLIAGNHYGICFRAAGLILPNRINLRGDHSNPTYANGEELNSMDGGVTWGSEPTVDTLFKIFK